MLLKPLNIIQCFDWGDSFTYGAGASAGESYVDYLQNFFNKYYGQDFVKVINYGFPGRNTSQLLSKFNSDIKKTVPNMVIFLAGVQNLYNFHGYRTDQSFHKPVHDNLKIWLNNFKIYRLAVLLLNDIIERKVYRLYSDKGSETGIGNEIRQRGYFLRVHNYPSSGEYGRIGDSFYFSDNFMQAKDFYEKALKKGEEKGKEERLYLKIGACYLELEKREEARQWYEKVITAKPECSDGYSALAYIEYAKQDWETAIFFAEKTVELDRQNILATVLLAHSWSISRDPDGAMEIFKRALEFDIDGLSEYVYPMISDLYKNTNNHNEGLRFFMERLQLDKEALSYVYMFKEGLVEENIKAWVMHDIVELADICKKNNIHFVLQNYPSVPYSENYILSKWIEELAYDYNYFFINQYEYFNEISNKDEYFYLNHCNANGYRLMAERVFNKIIAEYADDFGELK
jgi:tetratricopeptide (TPR) repeat protein